MRRYCVLRGDIREFGRLMEEPAVERAVRGTLRRAVETPAAGGRVRIVGGTALKIVARIEPLVGPSEIWVTEKFRQRLERRATLYRAVEVTPPAGRAGAVGGAVDVSKPGSGEPEIWLKLYRIVPRAR